MPLRLFMREKGIAGQFEEVIYDMSPDGDQRKWPHLKMKHSRRPTPIATATWRS